jgi:hypothetical protein
MSRSEATLPFANPVRPSRLDDIKAQWPSFQSIPTSHVVGLFVGNGVGSKLLQAYLDGSPDLYMLPAYPLIYFYPHWKDWTKQYGRAWDWDLAIEKFCEKHASVIDSRRIPGFNGLRSLGKDADEYVAVDETLFRGVLAHLLRGEAMSSGTFVRAVHYTYALCRGEDIRQKRVMLYHVHAVDYLHEFLADFPDAQIVTMTRDPRSNLGRRIAACYNVDAGKLNKSDTYLFRSLPSYNNTRYILEDNQIIARAVPPERLRCVRHEDFGVRLEETLETLCAWIGLAYTPEMLNVTFGGKEWWGDDVYNMERTNKFNPRVLSKSWQKDKGRVDWFVEEGLMVDFFARYGYEAYKYTNDTPFHRAVLAIASLWPTRFEWGVVRFYLDPRTFIEFVRAAAAEARGTLPIKDYTWNATYLYKWMYLELRLWETRGHVRALQSIRKSWPSTSRMQSIATAMYVGGQMARYVWAVVRVPYWYGRTRKAMFMRMKERWSGEAKLPELLVPLR